MVFSVNTNQGAFVALQNLTRTIKDLELTQLHVTTGLKVNGPKDDAATFAIAQNQRGDIAGFLAVKTALASGEASVGVAVEAAKSISDLLIEMKQKLREQIKTIVATRTMSTWTVGTSWCGAIM